LPLVLGSMGLLERKGWAERATLTEERTEVNRSAAIGARLALTNASASESERDELAGWNFISARAQDEANKHLTALFHSLLGGLSVAIPLLSSPALDLRPVALIHPPR